MIMWIRRRYNRTLLWLLNHSDFIPLLEHGQELYNLGYTHGLHDANVETHLQVRLDYREKANNISTGQGEQE